MISLGANSLKSHPLASSERKIHAELAAIIAASGNVSGATLYSARVMQSGEPGNSAPCAGCQHLIEAYGIARVVYHDGSELRSYQCR